MIQKNPFLIESREEVVKSIVNWSKSKQLWTIPKKQRFKKIKAVCPHAFYKNDTSTITNIQINFPKSNRKVFEDSRIVPSPTQYQTSQIDNQKQKGISFGLSRDNCRFSSYIKHQIAQNPAPNQYEKFASQQQTKSQKGFTLRPKTANHRTYFIDNKELAQVPSPSKYIIQQKGQLSQSKFKSFYLGSVGMMKRSKRFYSSIQNPGPVDYQPKKISLKNINIGGKIGNSKRSSFIDKAIQTSKSPGPGNYVLPSQFGHYKKSNFRRIYTIQ